MQLLGVQGLLQSYGDRLRSELGVSFAEVSDESPSHASHYETTTVDQPSLSVCIKGDGLLSGLSLVECHRMIYGLFEKELANGQIHALRISLYLNL